MLTGLLPAHRCTAGKLLPNFLIGWWQVGCTDALCGEWLILLKLMLGVGSVPPEKF